MLGGALTDLETVPTISPDLARPMQSLKELIVGSCRWPRRSDQPALSPAALERPPARRVSCRGPVAGRHRRLRREPRHDLCPVVPPGSAGPGLGRHPGDLHGRRPERLAPWARYFVLAPYLGYRYRPRSACPPGSTGSRSSSMDGGQRTGTVQSTFSDAQAFLARDLTTAFCRPPDWMRRTDGIPGLIDGFNSADGQHGAVCALVTACPGTLPPAARSDARRWRT